MNNRIYRNYLLGILLVLYAFNAVDRLAFGLVQQNIKADLHLTDTQLGLLTGIAFALFYSVMGIPIARWADRGNRVTIIVLTAALWSVMVAVCGWATSFAQLLLLRVGVAVGEAGCVPTANSLIADYFTRAERPRAVSTYLLGGSLSVVVGYLLAGWLNQFYGWRVVFVVLGLPGLGIAALAWLSLREPRRGPAGMPHQWSVKQVCVSLWGNATFRHLLAGFSVASFFGYGIMQWQPAFFIRSYGMNTGELGTWFTLIYGLGGFVGTYMGGAFASRHAAQNERLQLSAIALVYVCFSVVSASIYLSMNRFVAFGLTGISFVAGATISGPLFATIQTLVPERMRAISIAIVYLFANLIGMGLGPLAAGVLSDAFREWAGGESLRYALLALSPGYLWAGWHVWRASRTVSRDLGALQDSEAVLST